MPERIRFTAPLARTGVWTADGRMLDLPQGSVWHRELPLDILHRPSVMAPGSELPDPLIRPGRVDSIEFADGLVSVHGSMESTPTGKSLLDLLMAGSLYLAPDLDHVHPVVETDFRFFEPLKDSLEDALFGHRIRFATWRICAVWLEAAPCWELPAARLVAEAADPGVSETARQSTTHPRPQ